MSQAFTRSVRSSGVVAMASVNQPGAVSIAPDGIRRAIRVAGVSEEPVVRALTMLLALGAVASLAAGCGDDDAATSATTIAAPATVAPATTMPSRAMTTPMSAPSTGGATTTATAAPGGPAPMVVTVDIADFKFSSPSVRVAAGGTVTWTNRDDQ